MEAKPYGWLWPGYLCEGKIATFNGEPGHGKSLVALDIAARLTTGSKFPDGSANELPPADVLLLTVEEDAEDTILPRFLVAGGDPKRLHRITMDGKAAWFAIEQSIDSLNEIFHAKPTIKLVIVDPLMDFTKVEQNKEGDVRAALNPMRDLAEKHGLCILGVNHFNKKSDLAAIHRVSGARAWTGVARLNFVVGKGADPKLRHVCVLKNNITPDEASLDFILESCVLAATGQSYPRIVWRGRGSATAEDVTSAQRPNREKDTDAIDGWLISQLASREWEDAASIMASGEVQGYGERRIQRAADRLKVERQRTKTMPAKSQWRLPRPAETKPVQESTNGQDTREGWTTI
jgi:hypothetical protein